MMAAISSAESGNSVTILEKMNSLGRKLLITGKGRCNITSSIPMEEFISNIPGNGRFLYSSFLPKLFIFSSIVTLFPYSALLIAAIIPAGPPTYNNYFHFFLLLKSATN